MCSEDSYSKKNQHLHDPVTVTVNVNVTVTKTVNVTVTGLLNLPPESLKQYLCLTDAYLNKQQNCNHCHALEAYSYGQTLQEQDGLQMADHTFSAPITLTSTMVKPGSSLCRLTPKIF